MARTGVGAQGAPAQLPSCGEGGRGGSSGGRGCKMGRSPGLKHRGGSRVCSERLQDGVNHPAGISLALCWASHLGWN